MRRMELAAENGMNGGGVELRPFSACEREGTPKLTECDSTTGVRKRSAVVASTGATAALCRWTMQHEPLACIAEVSQA